VERRTISSGQPLEAIAGYSRAVVAGAHVYVAGTVARTEDGSPPPDDAYLQARRCLEIILAALAEAGATAADVVRTRMFLTRAEDFDAVTRAHAEVFREIRPAATAVVVSALAAPGLLVEIEADAVLPRPS
jgi:enamine deaminase RidA (YjgF/YER057c/UK114 family)